MDAFRDTRRRDPDASFGWKLERSGLCRVNRSEARNCREGRNLLGSAADPSSRRVRRLRNVGPRGLPFPSPPLN